VNDLGGGVGEIAKKFGVGCCGVKTRYTI
jgi:hypothetical protein